MKNYYVYILSSGKNGTLYIGMTSDLIGRTHQHKSKSVKGFTEKYDIENLVYFEMTTDVHAAIEREKQLKHWKRAWKIELIEKENPTWSDLYPNLISGSPLSQG